MNPPTPRRWSPARPALAAALALTAGASFYLSGGRRPRPVTPGPGRPAPPPDPRGPRPPPAPVAATTKEIVAAARRELAGASLLVRVRGGPPVPRVAGASRPGAAPFLRGRPDELGRCLRHLPAVYAAVDQFVTLRSRGPLSTEARRAFRALAGALEDDGLPAIDLALADLPAAPPPRPATARDVTRWRESGMPRPADPLPGWTGVAAAAQAEEEAEVTRLEGRIEAALRGRQRLPFRNPFLGAGTIFAEVGNLGDLVASAWQAPGQRAPIARWLSGTAGPLRRGLFALGQAVRAGEPGLDEAILTLTHFNRRRLTLLHQGFSYLPLRLLVGPLDDRPAARLLRGRLGAAIAIQHQLTAREGERWAAALADLEGFLAGRPPRPEAAPTARRTRSRLRAEVAWTGLRIALQAEPRCDPERVGGYVTRQLGPLSERVYQSRVRTAEIFSDCFRRDPAPLGVSAAVLDRLWAAVEGDTPRLTGVGARWREMADRLRDDPGPGGG